MVIKEGGGGWWCLPDMLDNNEGGKAIDVFMLHVSFPRCGGVAVWRMSG
jgi:hypothetical protein